MKTTAAIASLLAATPVLGANLLAFTTSGCGGGSYTGCNGIPSGYCCGWVSGTQGAVSGLWQNIPQAATLFVFQQVRSSNSPCGTVINSGNVNAGTYCLSSNPNQGTFSGGAWNARSAKFRRGDESQCIGTVEPDTFYTPDGTMYDLTKMSLEQKQSLLNGTDTAAANANAVPAKYDVFKKIGKAPALPSFITL